MAQFDVYRNPHPGSRERVPYVVDVQSGLIDGLPTRLAMPLSRVGAGARKLPASLCPVFEIKGEALLLMAHQAAPLPVRLLGKPVLTVAHRSSEVVAAMDAVLSGI